MGFPKRGRVTMRWSRGQRDWVVSWGPGPGRLKGPAGGLMRLVLGGGGEEAGELFDAELRQMGFDPATFRAQVDVLPQTAGGAGREGE